MRHRLDKGQVGPYPNTPETTRRAVHLADAMQHAFGDEEPADVADACIVVLMSIVTTAEGDTLQGIEAVRKTMLAMAPAELH